MKATSLLVSFEDLRKTGDLRLRSYGCDHVLYRPANLVEYTRAALWSLYRIFKARPWSTHLPASLTMWVASSAWLHTLLGGWFLPVLGGAAITAASGLLLATVLGAHASIMLSSMKLEMSGWVRFGATVLPEDPTQVEKVASLWKNRPMPVPMRFDALPRESLLQLASLAEKLERTAVVIQEGRAVIRDLPADASHEFNAIQATVDSALLEYGVDWQELKDLFERLRESAALIRDEEYRHNKLRDIERAHRWLLRHS